MSTRRRAPYRGKHITRTPEGPMLLIKGPDGDVIAKRLLSPDGEDAKRINAMDADDDAIGWSK